MKKVVFLSLTLLLRWDMAAQRIKTNALPPAVQARFQSEFVGAKDAKWEKEGANYEVEFELGEVEQSALFDASGALLETEVEIKFAELPEAVKEYLKKNYASQKIKEVTKITDNQHTITYEVEIKGRDVLFDVAGQFLREVANSH